MIKNSIWKLTRDIAAKFNNDFADKIKEFGHGDDGYFPITDPVIEGPATRVMSFRDGSKKMSKSEPSDMSRINLTDSAEEIAKKIRKAKTDPEPLPETMEGLAERPEARNLIGIYAALSEKTPDVVLNEFAGQQFGTFKPALADLAVEKLAPINAEMRKLMNDPAHVDNILADGADRARIIAQDTMKDVREIFGFLG
ncbi:Tryptophan--tRNA ligase [Nymphon striatum]|nr:Tryptophan--tRNA ligase [Nymphon striatum]